ncbi:hypothetical protein GCM10028820_02920 [Tessaracoccus terricola]
MSRKSRGARFGAVPVLAAGLVVAGIAPANAEIPPPESPDGIAEIVEAMTLEQLVGQMTWTHVYGNSADDTSMAASNQERYGVDTPAEVIEKFDLGGVLYFAWSNPVVTNDPEGTAELSNGLQAASIGDDGSGIPLAVTIDQEGGIVARMGAPATVLPGNMALGATFDAGLAEAQGAVLGSELAAVGINVDFAPVVDINTNPANPVIGVRSMGADPETVGELGAAQIRGMQGENVAAAAKHFPGHGDTETDSHTGLPIVTYPRDVLDQHLIPFQAAIDEGVDMIMTAHVIVEAIDPDMPGTLSHAVLTDLLRGELGFDGVVTTDALDMDALKVLPENPLDDGQIAVLAIQAGSDILLNSPDVQASLDGVLDAVAQGDLTRERLEESVTRILEWKLERGVWEDDPSVPLDGVTDLVGNDDHLATAAEISDRAVTLLRNEGDVLPLDPDSDSILMVGAGSAWPERMGPMLIERGFQVTEDYENGSSPSEEYRNRAVAAADEHDAVIFASYNASGNAAQQAMVAALAETGVPLIVVSVRNPYDINVFPDADAVLATYGWGVPNFTAAVRAVAADFNPSGRLPVDVPSASGDEVLLELGFGLRYGEEVTPEDVVFTDEPGTEEDIYTVPDVAGVVYLVDGEIVEAGTHPGAGEVTVTAEAEGLNYLADGATTSWSHTFDATSPSPSPSPSPTPTDEPEEPGVDVYSTPGFHNVNGRWWYTECEPYSQTIRCTTDIWATQVTHENGRFVGSTDWHFNNLTYLPFMARAQWSQNPLGYAGEWTSTDGRQWRTECDTAETGRNGCRSWIQARFIAGTQGADGTWSYSWQEGWVFNNMVRFKVN